MVNQVSTTHGLSWFALNTRLRYEEFVAKHLSNKGYKVLLPVYQCRRRWSDRVKEIELPLFPGYLFCRFDCMHRLPILTTPGMIQIVGFGKTPVPVDESEIAAIESVVSSNLARGPWPYLRLGERVRVDYGALRGVEGILLNIKGGHKLILSVTLLQRSVAVEVDSGWVVHASQKGLGLGDSAAISVA